ncbi:DUF4202 domain-containing protein [Methylocystis bryophila]|uniref:DUF4202 domain-containing protein n=1 Tax=Methylocystis bryophila TaxID=655015 RepID=A0A1W6MYT6_9HYPH|nr:DUF4202 domain-containing protein [Methylocystis bryophila]ARN82742.1 hypothetical protein B1812_18440 [Methylocystis bryophila]BDV38977.1 hypothetical protein DSM21852_22300 [Methylocystis bryophila]
MSVSTSRLAATFAAIDAANAEDPRRLETNNGEIGFEELYARRMSEALSRVYPEASELLQIAARAQHLRRWEIPRADFPDGRHGYNDWRKTCRAHHAERAGAIMRAAGWSEEDAERVGALIRKERLKKDPESQALENIAALVFLEHYFDDFLAKYQSYDDDKLVDILGKTLCKMSPRGHAAALTLSLAPRAKALVAKAVEREAAALARLAEVAVD